MNIKTKFILGFVYFLALGVMGYFLVEFFNNKVFEFSYIMFTSLSIVRFLSSDNNIKDND